jgi:hypothetical protein
MAMPRLRPLELVSRSVGQEWSLLPPNVSFRTELKALYAAMMRTFCLSAAAIRSMCSWDPQSLQEQVPAAAPTFRTDTISLDVRRAGRSTDHKNLQWNTLAGGACAIGGAAAIAWLVANHPTHPASPSLAAAPEVTLGASARDTDSIAVAGPGHSRAGKVQQSSSAPGTSNRARGNLSTPHETTSAWQAPAVREARAAAARTQPLTMTDAGVVRAHPAKHERHAIANAGAHRLPRATVRLSDLTPSTYYACPPKHSGTHRSPRCIASVRCLPLRVRTRLPRPRRRAAATTLLSRCRREHMCAR